jgi:alpha-glucoside transport system substrate-binding protein
MWIVRQIELWMKRKQGRSQYHTNNRRSSATRQKLGTKIILFSIGLLFLFACQTQQPSSKDSNPTTTTIDKNPTVKILAAFNVVDTMLYEKSFDDFKKATGIAVKMIPADAEFANAISVAAEGLDTPDIAFFPQPGLYAELVRSGTIEPLESKVEALAKKSLPKELVDTATVDGKMYGVWVQNHPKSLVWYRTDIFQQRGYKIPKTWQEMENLSRRAIRDGYTPWCIGIKAKGGTGWIVTDWIEEIVLRLYKPEVYDRWVKHEIKFDSPEILKAFEVFDRLIRTPKMVYGGTSAMLSTFIEDSILPMFENPPQCLMNRQSMLIQSQFPDNIEFGKDGYVDVFQLPPMENRKENIMLTGGDIAVALNNKPEVLQTIEYLISPEFGAKMIQNNNALSPNKLVGIDRYKSLLAQTIARFWRNSKIIRFDASDIMPSAVGTGSFWTGATDFVEGKSAKKVVQEIDLSWSSLPK